MGIHDTDRILGVLGDSITALRAAARVGDLYTVAPEVANDLALLHGAVSAERDRADEDEHPFPEKFSDDLERYLGNAPRVSIVADGRGAKQAFLRLLKREEIEQEVLNGEHREDD